VPQAAAPTSGSGLGLWWLAIFGGLLLVALLVALVRLRPEAPGFGERVAGLAPIAWIRDRRTTLPSRPPTGAAATTGSRPPAPPAPRPTVVPPPPAGPGFVERVTSRFQRSPGPRLKGPTLRQRLAQSSFGHGLADRFSRPKIKGPSLRQRMRNTAFARKMRKSDMAEGMRARKAAKDLRATIEQRQKDLGVPPPPEPKRHP
jgi:hypothetical protein